MDDNGNAIGFTNDPKPAFLEESLTVVNPVELEGDPRPGFAVDGERSFYSGSELEEKTLIQKQDFEGFRLIAALDDENTTGVAADQKINDVYLDHGTHVRAFAGDGRSIQEFGSLTAGTGIAVDAKTNEVYVADAGTGQIDVFGPEKAGQPFVDEIGVQNVTSQSADLTAQIDAHGVDTHYCFQYATSPIITSSASCAAGECQAASSACTQVPVPAADIGEGFGDAPVVVHVSGLSPSTTYYFSATAESAAGKDTLAGAPLANFTTSATGTGFALPRRPRLGNRLPARQAGRQRAADQRNRGAIQASADGSALAYITDLPIEAGAEGAAAGTEPTQDLATRGASSWSSKDVATPHSQGTGTQIGKPPEYHLFSSNLSLALVQPPGCSRQWPNRRSRHRRTAKWKPRPTSRRRPTCAPTP